MPVSLLVAYATHAAPTQEVARAIATTFLNRGLATELHPMPSVRTLVGYNAIVLGAPLENGRWHKDAHHFLAHHRAQLGERKVAIFALGPVQDVAKEWQAARDELRQALAQFSWLKPVAVEVFGNQSAPAKSRFPLSLLSANRQPPGRDIRDWVAIQAWANKLAAQF